MAMIELHKKTTSTLFFSSLAIIKVHEKSQTLSNSSHG
jgi:hypothetical protein